MKLTEYAISKKTVSYFIVLFLIAGGIYAFQKLGKLEFPSFTIKTAVVIVPYAGASAVQVEQEVTELMEKSIQQMSQVKSVRSISKTNQAIIYVDIKEHYFSDAIPQIWDELRRKVNDAVKYLPQGAGPAAVMDDFGDVYGVFFAVTGDGYTYEELKDYVDFLKRELLLVKDVASVETWGEQQEVIYLEMEKARMAELGISMESILQTLSLQNQVVDSGRIELGKEHIRLVPTGEISAVEDLGDLLISSDRQQNLVYLKDVVNIKRNYNDPPQNIMRYNSKPALGLGIATVDGGNVVEMGRAVRDRIQQLESEMPVGMELNVIAYQSDLVSRSVNDFMINLIEAVAIVIAVLCITMGLSSGILMGVILLLTILGTFIVMYLMEINLQIISLGALILALGMLVDNAIVVTEGILVRVQQGSGRAEAALATVKQTAWPLLGATLVAVLAFAGIGTSRDVTGEFLRSLFLVMAISLGLSWLLAITLTPLFCVLFLRRPEADQIKNPYNGKFFKLYRRFLDYCLIHRFKTTITLIGLLFAAIVGFGFIENSFFPNDNRNQFNIHLWCPEGTHISQTNESIKKVEDYLTKLDEVTAVTAFIGQGSLRFLLSYEPQMPNSSFAQALVTVKDYRTIDMLIPKLREHFTEMLPEARIEFRKVARGADTPGKIEVRFQGPDRTVLRQLALKAQKIMATDPLAIDINSDWRQKTLLVRPHVTEAAARRLGITRPQVANMLSMNFSGKVVGMYREENNMIPIILQTPATERGSVEQMDDIPIFSPVTGQALPLKQIVSGVAATWEDPIIYRRDRKRTITARCNQISGNASVLFERLRPLIEAIELPAGYQLEWGGEYERSRDAQKRLFKMIPIFFLAMIFVVLTLFNAIRQTVIIFLCLPLATIGVAAGLLFFHEPFGFMCLLGFLGLSGMLIKNAVVLIDQIDLEINSGKAPYSAILDSSVSRLRPVTMAAVTTVFGMLPLVADAFFSGMSVTIMGGLTFGTILTLVVVPVLYATFFKIKPATST